MKWIIAFFLIAAFFLSAAAQQSIDLLTLSGQYGLPQSYESQLPDRATEYAGLINLKLPAVFSESTIWYNDLTYTYYQVENDPDMADGLADPIRLHGFILQTGLVQQIDEKHSIQLLLAPRFMSDFQNVDGDHWQLGGLALYETRYREGLSIGFGVMYNKEFFGHLAQPLVNLNWRLAPRWSITGLLPIYGKLKYKVSEPFTAGLSFFGLNTSYRLGNPAYRGDYLERRSIDVTFFGRRRIAGNLYAEARAGYSMSRQYYQYDADEQMHLRLVLFSFGDDRTAKNVSFNDGPILNLRLVYNLPLDEES